MRNTLSSSSMKPCSTTSGRASTIGLPMMSRRADQFEVSLVGDLVDVLRSAQHRDRARRLPEHVAQPCALLVEQLPRADLRGRLEALRQQSANRPVMLVQRDDAVAPPAVAFAAALHGRCWSVTDTPCPVAAPPRTAAAIVPQISSRDSRAGRPIAHGCRPAAWLRPGVVVERDEVRAPVDRRRDRGVEADRQRRPQRFRPRLRRPQRRRRPVERPDQLARIPAAGKKGLNRQEQSPSALCSASRHKIPVSRRGKRRSPALSRSRPNQ